jgi:membrane protein YqaA with SNARE-associated domain
MMTFLYKVSMPTQIVATVFVLGTITGIIGGVVGYFLGDRIKGLIG